MFFILFSRDTFAQMAAILIDLRPLLQDCISEEATQFIIENLDLFCQEHPGEEWVFLTSQSRGHRQLPAFIQQRLLIKKGLPGKMGWRAWYGWQLPRAMKKYKASLLISTGAAASGSYPQWIWMPGTVIRPKTKNISSYLHFCSGRMAFTLKTSQAVFVFSEMEKQSLGIKYQGDIRKINVVYARPGEDFRVLSWPEKENGKVCYAGGKEYFVVTGSSHISVLVTLLKAFSQFKKQQQSTMQLVIAVTGIGRDAAFNDKLKMYKYRSDVHVHDRQKAKEWAKILSAAYGIICLGENDIPGTNLLNAFQATTPVIAADNAVMHETAGDAVRYVDVNDVSSIARQIILLYKDENMRNALQEKGKTQLQLCLTRQTTPDLLTKLLKVIFNGIAKDSITPMAQLGDFN